MYQFEPEVLLKRAVQVKEQVSEIVVLGLQIRCSQKFLKFQRKTPVLESLFNKVADLQAYQKETSPQVFSCEICKISKNTFFYRTALLRFNSYFQRSPEQKPVRLSAKYQIPNSAEKTYLLPRKPRSNHPQIFWKRRPANLLERGPSIAKFFRTPTLKNICERLLLKISFSVTNLPKGGNS